VEAANEEAVEAANEALSIHDNICTEGAATKKDINIIKYAHACRSLVVTRQAPGGPGPQNAEGWGGAFLKLEYLNKSSVTVTDSDR
jgi:hypothetical protein